MALTVDQLQELVGSDASKYDELSDTLEQATVLVQDYVGDSVVPEPIMDLAIKRVAVALWSAENSRAATNTQFYENTEAGALAPANRDPMIGAYIILRKFVLPW